MKNYEIYDLGGNITAIIKENLCEKDCYAVANEIMKKHKEVEQVAMIINVNKNTCTFRMEGYEFCGNACRAVAKFMERNYKYQNSKIIINEIKINGNSTEKQSMISILKEQLINKIENEKDFVVFMNGIVCIVKPNVEKIKRQGVANKIKDEYEDKFDKALGVIFIDEDNSALTDTEATPLYKIDPFVWVKKSRTFFNETACLSGSIASALYIKQNKIGRVFITQPTNEKYLISISTKNIKASGKAEYIKTDG